MTRLPPIVLGLVACAPSNDDDLSSNRVTLRAGFSVTETALVLETLDVVDLAPNTAGGRDHGPADLSLGVAQVLSMGSVRGPDDTPVQLCPRGQSASIDDATDDTTNCEWSPRWYFAPNTGDAFLDDLITTSALAEDADGTRYRMWIADGTFADNVLELSLDIASE